MMDFYKKLNGALVFLNGVCEIIRNSKRCLVENLAYSQKQTRIFVQFFLSLQQGNFLDSQLTKNCNF